MTECVEKPALDGTTAHRTWPEKDKTSAWNYVILISPDVIHIPPSHQPERSKGASYTEAEVPGRLGEFPVNSQSPHCSGWYVRGSRATNKQGSIRVNNVKKACLSCLTPFKGTGGITCFSHLESHRRHLHRSSVTGRGGKAGCEELLRHPRQLLVKNVLESLSPDFLSPRDHQLIS